MSEIIKTNIENLIYEIRGKEVMLDSDLAKLYNCKNGTKTINQAVNRNKERFPSDFYFQLTEDEYNNLRSQSVTANHENMIRYLPYVFTEQGVAMLASVLRTDVASEVSIRIMRAFVAMRHYLIENKDIYKSLNKINNRLDEHDDKLNYLFSRFDKKEYLFMSNEIYDAYSKILDIFRLAKKELIIVDAYADKSVLDIIRNIKCHVTIITKKPSKLVKKDIETYNKQYNNLKIIYNNTYYDRYFIIDNNEIYHSGSSINYAGYKTFSINKLEDKSIVKDLLNNVYEICKNNNMTMNN